MTRQEIKDVWHYILIMKQCLLNGTNGMKYHGDIDKMNLFSSPKNLNCTSGMPASELFKSVWESWWKAACLCGGNVRPWRRFFDSDNG